MTRLRLCIALLLAVLLSVQGAAAAAMLCPLTTDLAGPAAHHASTGMDMNVDMVMDTATDMDMGTGTNTRTAVQAVHDAAGAHHHAGGSAHCDLCATFSSLLPVPGSLPAPAAPLTRLATVFPDVRALGAGFQPDGQERPPRST